MSKREIIMFFFFGAMSGIVLFLTYAKAASVIIQPSTNYTINESYVYCSQCSPVNVTCNYPENSTYVYYNISWFGMNTSEYEKNFLACKDSLVSCNVLRDEAKKNYDKSLTEFDSCKSNFQSLSANATACIISSGQCSSDLSAYKAKSEGEKNNAYMIAGIAGLGAGYFLFHKKEEAPSEVGELPPFG